MEQIAGMFAPQGTPAAFSANPLVAGPQNGKGDWLAVISELGKGVAGAGAQIGGARQAELEARSARVAGREEASRIRSRGRAITAAGRAAAGAQGTTLEGSPLVVELENVRQYELDAATAIYASKLESLYKKTEAKQRYAGAADQFLAGVTRAGKSLLTRSSYS